MSSSKILEKSDVIKDTPEFKISILEEKVRSLEAQISNLQGLNAKVDANVNLMDDLLSDVGNTLTHANTVLTSYVGWGTVVIALISVGAYLFVEHINNKRRKDVIQDAIYDGTLFDSFFAEMRNDSTKIKEFRKLIIDIIDIKDPQDNVPSPEFINKNYDLDKPKKGE